MTTDTPALRALVIYGLCLPVAILVGYLLAQPLQLEYIVPVGLTLLLIFAPFFLKWHYALMVAGVNMSAYFFLLPGRPELWLVLGGFSFCLSVLQLTLARRWGFLHAPTVTLPLLALLAVVVLTAKLTGGIGFHAFGGESIGGKRYINILGAVIVYFALIARRIPPQQAGFYCALFFLGGITSAVSSLVHVVTPSFYYIFLFFPPDAGLNQSSVGGTDGMVRLGGVAFSTVAMVSFLLAKYGLRGLFLADKPWRALALLSCLVLSLVGGFRVVLVTILFYLALQAYLEGFYKSRLAPVLAMGLVLIAVACLPFVSKLPMTFQRALSVLPAVEVSPEAREAARVSSEWRLHIWQEVLPEAKRYLWLGKGYAMSVEEWSQANASTALASENGAIVSGDYHNGPLSLIIPFGIWGVLAFLWLLWAGGRLLYCNYRYGDPSLRNVNCFLLVAFIAHVIIYLAVFGGFHSELYKFTAVFGLSIALNGGRCRPAPAVARPPLNLKFRLPLKAASGFSK